MDLLGPAQRLFLSALGPDRVGSPPAVGLSAEASAHLRERERLLAALRKSCALDCGSTAAGGVAVGMTYGAPPHIYPCAPALPHVPHLPGLTPSPLELPRAATAGALHPAAASVWAAAHPPLVGASGAQFGCNSTLSVLGERFNGASADAFVDVKGLGMDCSVSAAPGGGVSGDVELSAALRALRSAHGCPTVSHKVAVPQLVPAPRVVHITTVTAPLALFGGDTARVQLRRHPGGCSGRARPRDVLRLELCRKGSSGKGSSGKASSGTLGRLGTAGAANSSNSDSEGEDDAGVKRRPAGRTPQLRVEFGREAGVRGDLALRWRQVWGVWLQTTAQASTAPAARMSLNVRGRPTAGVQAGGTVVVGAAPPVGPLGMQQAGIKLVYRMRPRHSVHLESSVSTVGSGPSHALSLRRRGAPGNGGWVDVALKLAPRSRQASLEFSVDVAV